MRHKVAIDISHLLITTRLLVEEALRRGYSISAMAGRPSTRSYTIRCEKDGREFYFRSLCTALSPSYAVFAAVYKILTQCMLDSAGILMPAR